MLLLALLLLFFLLLAVVLGVRVFRAHRGYFGGILGGGRRGGRLFYRDFGRWLVTIVDIVGGVHLELRFTVAQLGGWFSHRGASNGEAFGKLQWGQVEQSTTSGGGGQPGDAGDVEDELD